MEGVVVLVLGELTFLTPLGRRCWGLEEQQDICAPRARVCSPVRASIHAPTGGARSGSVSAPGLGTGTCSSHAPTAGAGDAEGQAVTAPWPCTSLGQLEHSVQGSTGAPTLLSLCHLPGSSWLSPGSAANRAWGTQTTSSRLVSPPCFHSGPGGPVTPEHSQGCLLRTLFFTALQHLLLSPASIPTGTGCSDPEEGFPFSIEAKISRTVMHPGV